LAAALTSLCMCSCTRLSPRWPEVEGDTVRVFGAKACFSRAMG
jgi:hypothetical protein